jgi:Cu-Zn family superoxide dismutase
MYHSSVTHWQILLSLTFALAFMGCDAPSSTNDRPSTDVNSTATAPETTAPSQVEGRQAVCELEAVGDSGVSGTIHFADQGGKVHIHGKITGLTPGKHGFHVHEKGDLSDKETGKSAGDHFNPAGHPHGRPGDSQRHVGDLGNIEANEDGTAEIHIEDAIVELDGEHSIVGRSLVVHAGEDQFTQPSGDAGGRVAFGVIEITNAE